MDMPDAQGDWKKISDPLEMELQTDGGHRVGAGY